MQLTSAIAENRVIASLTTGLPRAPRQRNGVHEADAELIDVDPRSEHLLAVKTDAVVEEIASGLYRDPWLAGWMVVMENLSDLAAVGAEPIGVLVAVVLPRAADEPYRQELARGIGAACRRVGTFVLGGDTNEGTELMISGAAIGRVPRRCVMTRLGARPGDAVYLTGRAGLGAAYALARLVGGGGGPEITFRPVARIADGQVIRASARCCMDTSDGVLHTLDTLMRLNGCGFVLDGAWGEVLHPAALELCRRRHIPPWLALACVHGELELCFSVAPGDEDRLWRDAIAGGIELVRIGEVVPGSGVAVRTAEGPVALDTVAIRNLGAGAAADPGAYVRALVSLARSPAQQALGRLT